MRHVVELRRYGANVEQKNERTYFLDLHYKFEVLNATFLAEISHQNKMNGNIVRETIKFMLQTTDF